MPGAALVMSGLVEGPLGLVSGSELTVHMQTKGVRERSISSFLMSPGVKKEVWGQIRGLLDRGCGFHGEASWPLFAGVARVSWGWGLSFAGCVPWA